MEESIQAAPNVKANLETSMTMELDKLSHISSSRCIFRVPDRLRRVCKEAYTPRLPFFILKDLFDGVNCVDKKLNLLVLSHNFLADGSSTFEGMLDNLESINSSEVKHFVDLLRKLCIAPILKEKEEEKGTTAANQSLCISLRLCPKTEGKKYKDTTAPSISKLHLAGVKFKVAGVKSKVETSTTKNLFDIKFVNGILYIPELKTEDSTELILRNLIAFEQCTFDKNYISDYVSIMDEFLDTSKDVELLVKYGIVENILGGGDDELSTMINSLSTGIIYGSDFYYGTLCEQLNKFCSSKFNKRIANLRQKYFNTPWATISFFAALILLILTVIQTFCSVMSISA
ncbi:hypothetical protein M0R45_026616 [Rubus argutus]|uniref:Uncharacterized protein n=1 Tax=Rubus argutus TaxID=59490 RepID=A0AAW1X1P2_RUBAR